MVKSILFILFFTHFLIASAQEGKVDSTAAKPQALVDKYDLLILNAANAVANENFNEAKALYTEALLIKPNDPFAGGMLLTVNNSLKALEVIRQRSADLKRKDDINKLLNQAQTEVMAKNYESARILYNQILSLQPIKSQEDFVKQRLRAIDFASGGSKKNTGSNTGDSNNLLAAKKVASEEHSTRTSVNEQKNTAPVPAKTVVESATGVVKTEKDSLKPKAEATAKVSLNQKAISENEKNTVPTPSVNQTTVNSTPLKEQANSPLTNGATSSALAKQAVIPKQDEDVKKKVEETDSRRAAASSSVNLIASKNRVEPIKEDIRPSLVNTNTKSADSLKQVAIQKQNAEAKKRLQENESKNLPAVNTNAIPGATKQVPVKEEQKVTTGVAVPGNNSMQSKETDKQHNNSEVAKTAKIDSLIENAIKAINTEKWETALTLYTEALTLQPTAIQQRAINSEITVIKRNIAKSGNKLTDTNITKTAPAAIKPNPSGTTLNSSSASASAKMRETVASVSGNKNSSAATVNDLNRGTTIASAPNVNDGVVGTDLSSSKGAEMDTKKEDVEFAKRLVINPALSYLNDNNNEVKIICQSIFSNDKNVFLKFLVKNNSAVSDFDIGSLQLTVIKKD